MPTLQDILYKAPIEEIRGNLSLEIVDFVFDSRQAGPGMLYIARRGVAVDGHSFIPKAIAAGVVAVVCEEIPKGVGEEAAGSEGKASEGSGEGVTWVQVKNSDSALAVIAANFYDNPAEEMELIGVTGTNGKTTISTLLFDLFSEMGYKCGLFSTVVVRIGEHEQAATHTTPDAKSLHQIFRKMADEGCTYCFMEVSSHALVQGRVEGLKFAGAIFTNLTHDHLDYHGTFKEYIQAKKILFDGLSASAFALTNLDDKNGSVMLQNTKARRLGYSLQRMAEYKGRIVENTLEGIQMEINGHDAWFRMIGSFNAYNLLAAFGTAVEMELDGEECLLALSQISGVDGRFQTVRSPGRKFTAIVDYAHTPDALKNVLQTIRDVQDGAGKVITVVGCGGDRDRTKRPEMAKIATQLSDKVILTSDNPRTEEPGTILDEMYVGVPVTARRKVMRNVDRREAIIVACQLAEMNDIILVAGKGHETYQEINGVKHPFDDREILKETFKTLEH